MRRKDLLEGKDQMFFKANRQKLDDFYQIYHALTNLLMIINGIYFSCTLYYFCLHLDLISGY